MEVGINFKEIDWLNQYLANRARLNKDEIESILYFTLLWNLFEDEVCERNACVSRFERFVPRLKPNELKLSDFKESLLYFKKRYITDGEINDLFIRLNFRTNDKRESVENVLLGRDNTNNGMILALVIIVYRLRNNFFHGIKQLKTLRNQVDNFKHANRILAHIIELY